MGEAKKLMMGGGVKGMRGGNKRKRGEKRRNLGGPSRWSSVAACSMSQQTYSHTSAGGERGGHTTEITAEHPAQTGLQLINSAPTDAKRQITPNKYHTY